MKLSEVLSHVVATKHHDDCAICRKIHEYQARPVSLAPNGQDDAAAERSAEVGDAGTR